MSTFAASAHVLMGTWTGAFSARFRCSTLTWPGLKENVDPSSLMNAVNWRRPAQICEGKLNEACLNTVRG